MANKTKTKLAAMAEVRKAAALIFGTPDEESEDSLSFSERDSAGDDEPPRIKALYGQKWNEFSELSFHLLGNTSDGWTVRARFGMASITHKVTTSRGILQTVWKKLKAEIGDLANLDKINKQRTW